MLPTLHSTGDILFVDKLSLNWRPVQRDEVVVAASPHKLGETVCKRVLALVSDHEGGQQEHCAFRNLLFTGRGCRQCGWVADEDQGAFPFLPRKDTALHPFA